MNEWTSEPWEMDSEDRGKPTTYSEGFSIFAPNDEKKYFDICFIPTAETEIYDNHPKGHGEDKAIANAKRIVACINACEGINPEAVPDIIATLEKIKDEVLHFWNEDEGAYLDSITKLCNDLLTKARSEA